MSARAYFHPAAFRNSFSHPVEALFFPTCLLAIATLYVGMLAYAVPYVGFWLVRTLLVVWFVYIAASIGCSALLQWTLCVRARSYLSVWLSAAQV
jgi:hypothetical protein